PWPEWGAAPADLTPPGRTLITLMGGYYRQFLAASALLDPTGCRNANDVFIWADTDQRTIETGKALADSLMPGCGVAIHSGPADTADPIFDPIAAGLVKPDPNLSARAVHERLGTDSAAVLEERRAAFETLDRVLNGTGSAPERPFRNPAAIDVSITSGGVELT